MMSAKGKIWKRGSSKSHTIYDGQNWKMQMPRSVQLKWAPQIREERSFFHNTVCGLWER